MADTSNGLPSLSHRDITFLQIASLLEIWSQLTFKQLKLDRVTVSLRNVSKRSSLFLCCSRLSFYFSHSVSSKSKLFFLQLFIPSLPGLMLL